MKKIALFLLLLFEFNYPQMIPHKATLTASKDSILSDEIFTVTYSLQCPGGYIYIGLKEGYFEAIGNDRWEGEVTSEEIKTISFTIRLKDYYKKIINNSEVPLTVGFSYKPFDEKIRNLYSKSIIITVTDFYKIRKKQRSDINEKMNKNNNIINFIPQSIQGQRLKKWIEKEGDATPLENYRISTDNNILPEEKALDIKVEKEKHFVKLTYDSQTDYTVIFHASNVSFRDIQNQKLPLQYYRVEIWGLNSPTDQNPVTLASQDIGSSTTGGFNISAVINYPYYVLVLLLESPIYVALKPPVIWDPSIQTSLTIFSINTDVFEKPIENEDITVSDPDIGSNGVSEISKVLNICNFIRQGHNFVENNTNDIPNLSLLFFNEVNTNLKTSFANSYTDGITALPGIFIHDDHWDDIHTVLHEYGHVQEIIYGAFPIPEAGGTHYLGVRYNPQLAFSEGWGHFFASAVTNDPNLNSAFSLSSNPPYSVQYGHYYTPVTQFEGICDEVMVASLLWQMYTETNNNYEFMHNSNKWTSISDHKPYNIFEFIRNHRLYYDQQNGLGYWQRASQHLKIGSGIVYIDQGGSIQNAINSAPNKSIILNRTPYRRQQEKQLYLNKY